MVQFINENYDGRNNYPQFFVNWVVIELKISVTMTTISRFWMISSADNAGCGDDSMRVYYSVLYEDNDRDDSTGLTGIDSEF